MQKIISSLILPTFLLLNSNSLSGMENSKEHQEILKVLAVTSQKPSKSEIFDATALLSPKPSMEIDAYTIERSLKNEHLEILKRLTQASKRPNETCVPMWGFDSIIASPSIKSPLIISTDGLGGCLATTLHIKYDNGEQYAGMTHYTPLSDKDHKKSLKSLCLQALNAQNKTKKIVTTNFFFIAPKEEASSSSAFNFPMSINNLRRQILECIVKIKLEKTGTINTQNIPYDMFNDHSKKERDVELILYPDKATLTIKDKTFNL